MAKQKFNPGDLVQLKAGGPKMVVESVYAPTGFGGAPAQGSCVYECSWFSGAKHNSERFKEEALVVFQEEK